MKRRDDTTQECKNTRIAILGLTKYRMTGSFSTFHSIIYDHKDYNRDLNSDMPGVITRIGPPSSSYAAWSPGYLSFTFLLSSQYRFCSPFVFPHVLQFQLANTSPTWPYTFLSLNRWIWIWLNGTPLSGLSHNQLTVTFYIQTPIFTTMPCHSKGCWCISLKHPEVIFQAPFFTASHAGLDEISLHHLRWCIRSLRGHIRYNTHLFTLGRLSRLPYPSFSKTIVPYGRWNRSARVRFCRQATSISIDDSTRHTSKKRRNVHHHQGTSAWPR